jgi:4-carboxymuconolactone decarboxylase
MTPPDTRFANLSAFDDATRGLVRLSARVTVGDERDVREALARAATNIPALWVEELLLQSYLFAGFPRSLNAMREWRRIHPVVESPLASSETQGDARAAGEATCAVVYGGMYQRLRENVRALHPLLDERMVIDGYGMILSRTELDLGRRELCIVAACAASGQDRQLHSHLHGARNAGVAPAVIDAAVDTVAELLPPERATTVRLLWARVKGK